jgi:hypothetical protein
MGELSIGRAIGAGFDLIRRHPGAIAAWAIVYVVVGVLPQVGVLSLMGPVWAEMARNAAAGARAAPPGDLLQAQARMAQIQPLTWLLSIFSQTLLLGAAYRAVLFPEDSGFFFLRAGRRELWLGLALLVVYVGLVVVMIMAGIPVGILAGLLAVVTRGAGVAAVGGVVAVLALLCVALWVMLRFSLAPVTSFAEGRLRVFGSWSATRGHAGRMFLVALVIAVIAIVGELVMGLIGLMLLGGPARLVQLGDLIRRGALDWSSLLPVALGMGVVLALFGAGLYALMGGAWAQIYRELNPKPEEVF